MLQKFAIARQRARHRGRLLPHTGASLIVGHGSDMNLKKITLGGRYVLYGIVRRDRQTMLHNNAKKDALSARRNWLQRREEMDRLFSCLPLRGNKAYLLVSRGKGEELPILRRYADRGATFATLDESLLFDHSFVSEGCAIPLPDASVDMALCLLPSLRQEAHPNAARELYRVLRLGHLAYVLRFAPSFPDARSEEPPAPGAASTWPAQVPSARHGPTGENSTRLWPYERPSMPLQAP